MRTLIFGLLALFIMETLFVGLASAFCRQPRPLPVCAELFYSNAVFVGTVLSDRVIPATGDMYHLKNVRPLRGNLQNEVEVFSENSSGRFPMEIGKSYLLFVKRDPEGNFEVDNCGNSGALPEAKFIIDQVEDLLKNPKSGGVIEGQITIPPHFGKLAGANVIIIGEQQTFTGVTGEDGWFHVNVPLGNYTVMPEDADYEISPMDITYDSPDHVIIDNNGSCAELAFEARSKK